MRTFFLPLGLAVMAIQPLHAQSAADVLARPASSASALVEAAGPLHLETALGLAFQANAELAAAAREQAAVKAALSQAGLLPNPEIATLIEDTRRATRTTTLQLNQPIELGGQRAARLQAADRALDLAAAEFASRKGEVRAALIAAFFEVLIAQERVRLVGESTELAQRASAAAARRVTAGKVSPVEETRARVAEAGVKVEFAQAAGELRSARQRLAAFWGNASPRFTRAAGQVDVLPEAGEFPGLAASPGVRRAELEVARRQALTEVERTRRIPDVTVSLGVKRDEQLNHHQALIGLSLPLPVFNRNQGNIAEALHREDKARDELAAARIRLHSDAAQAWEGLQMARTEASILASEVLPGAQRAFDAASKGFELGKFGFLDVLDAQRTLLQAKSQHLRALATAHRQRAEVDRLVGGATIATAP